MRRPAGNHLRRRRSGGFTLLELLVVGMIGVLVLTFLGNAWRWFSRSSNELHAAEQIARELKLASEAIASDFGPGIAARTVDGSQLQINLDTDGDATADWAAPDTVIEYAVANGKLVRRDLLAATEVPMARQMTGFAVASAGADLTVQLAAEYRASDHTITLQLEGP
jgi:type II secretory pathway pseudopilin PulG